MRLFIIIILLIINFFVNTRVQIIGPVRKEFQGEHRYGRRRRERLSVGAGEATVGGQTTARGSEHAQRIRAQTAGQTDAGTSGDDEGVYGEEPGSTG